MIDVYLITGFLGSGKTTFLNKRLAETHKKTAVLMNEFGAVSMDTQTVQKDGLSLLELTNGSIFCSCLKDKFIDGLIQLLKMDIDEIFIESSGLSDPSDMGKVIEVVGYTIDKSAFRYAGSICLVDGLFFEKELQMMVSVERQIKHSHLIIINKTDLIGPEKLEEIREIISAINNDARLISSVQGEVDWKAISKENIFYAIQDESTTNTIDNKPKSIIMTLTQEVSKEALTEFLESVTDYFYRIKGFISIEKEVYKLDCVNSYINIEVYSQEVKQGKNEIVFLSSQKLKSISALSKSSDKYLAGCYKLKI